MTSDQFDDEVVPCPDCGFENTADFLECVNCGAMLRPDIGAGAEGSFVEILSTRDAKAAVEVGQRLKAAGIEFELLDLGGAEPDDLALLLQQSERMVPLMVLVPAEDKERAQAALADLRTGPAGAPPSAEPEQLRCSHCNEPYRLEDYDPQALRIYCSTCRAELPRHAPPRFRG